MPLATDASRKETEQAMFGETIGCSGTVQILVNNAGIQSRARFPDMTLAQWRRIMAVLASDPSDYTTGATVYVNGGMALYPSFRGNG